MGGEKEDEAWRVRGMGWMESEERKTRIAIAEIDKKQLQKSKRSGSSQREMESKKDGSESKA